MDTNRQNAYRYILYWAMIDIRYLAGQSYGFLYWLNPQLIRRERRNALHAAAIADWMHNLAQYSAIGFDEFDESEFWDYYDLLLKKFGPTHDYRKRFDEILTEFESRD